MGKHQTRVETDLRRSVRIAWQRVSPDRITVARRRRRRKTNFAIEAFAYGSVALSVFKNILWWSTCVWESAPRLDFFKVTLTSRDWKWISRRRVMVKGEKKKFISHFPFGHWTSDGNSRSDVVDDARPMCLIAHFSLRLSSLQFLISFHSFESY